MEYVELIGHRLQRDYLTKSFANGKIANSYLFYGRDGIGKKLVAMEFAAILNCTNFNAIDTATYNSDCSCISCQKIKKGVHPDVSIVISEGLKEIKIDQIREQIEELIYLKPYEGFYKVAVVDNAELMNINAQNAFLKTLEEPPLNSIIILITSKPHYLLPTIISRCQRIEFFPLSENVIQEFLKTSDFSEAELELVVKLARGSLGKSQILDRDFLEQWKDLIEKLSKHKTQDSCEICEFVDKFTRDKSPESADKINFLFEILFLWIKDILLVKNRMGKEYLLHKDLYELSKKMSSRWSFEDLFVKREFLEIARDAVFRLNINKQYVLENLALEFAES